MFTTTILGGLLPGASLALVLLCLLVSSIGFKKTVFFISIGYGYSIAAMALGSAASELVVANAIETGSATAAAKRRTCPATIACARVVTSLSAKVRTPRRKSWVFAAEATEGAAGGTVVLAA